MLLRGDITVVAVYASQVTFKNCGPFTKYITKIDGSTIDHAENLVKSMYNLLEYSSNYTETKEILLFYFKVEATDIDNNIANANNFKSFMYKAKLLESTVCQPAPNNIKIILKNARIVVPLKYLTYI